MDAGWLLTGVTAVGVGLALFAIWEEGSPPKPPAHVRAYREQQRLIENIKRLECETGLCDHMVNGSHPQLYTAQNGKRYWRLGPVMWEEGTPCPIAPTADAN